MIVLDFIRQQIPSGWKQTPSGWISGNCTMCHKRGHSADKRKRGGIIFSEDKFSYNCFNCNFKTGWSPGARINDRLAELLQTFGTDMADIQRINFELLKEKDEADIAGQFLTKEKAEIICIDWQPKELPPKSTRIGDVDVSLLNDDKLAKLTTACTYLVDRGLDHYADWHWSPHMHFASRVILPFYYKDNIVGYTARWCGDIRPDGMPKYYLQMPSNFVYNLDEQHQHEYVIVTEGQLDALQVGGIALAGNTPSDVQCSIIDQLDKQVVLLPDFDAAGKETVEIAIKRGWAVSFPPWEGAKDACDAVGKYGRLFTVSSVLNSIETNKTRIRLLAKQYCK
jgi:hypothetical protein|tara:strand:- start:604 stop:1620 length:1017 start_codon:yes stop_codon:yes gene_type:complete